MDKVLITGCNGLVGQILWHGLADSFMLFGLDRQPSRGASEIFQADITQPEQVDAVFAQVPDLACVVHLAGAASPDAPWEAAFHVNIGGTKNVYAAAQAHAVRRVVFASSNHATGAYEGFPASLHTRKVTRLITTDDLVRPDGFYGVSKIAGEAIARMYFELYGLRSVCLRIGSVTADDDPTKAPRLRSTWLSHRDLVQLVMRSLLADVDFGIYYGVSNNTGRFWDISDAERELGYHPEDNANER
jgi:nucleoside-diphosphate-sugar epimerase